MGYKAQRTSDARTCERDFETYPPPLTRLLNALSSYPSRIEVIAIAIHHPCWKHAMGIPIPLSKDEALSEERYEEAGIKMCSDSSGLEERIGMATVMFHRRPDGELAT